MTPVFVDVETFWSTDYSLSKMSPLEYVLDPQFELQSVSIAVGQRGTVRTAIGMQEIEALVDSIDWDDAFVIGHNMSGFDAYVLAYRLDIHPKMWGCTYAMSGPKYARTVGQSLAKLVTHFGLGVKNNAILMSTRGRRLSEFSLQEVGEMRVYNGDDTTQCRDLFYKLLPYFNADELWQIDCLVRMRTEPAFIADMPMLDKAAVIERERKHEMLLALADMLDIDEDEAWGTIDDEAYDLAIAESIRAVLASAPKFGQLLERLGVPVPLKPSPTVADMLIPALAKTDEQFIELQSHENPIVAAAARARLDIKSTILETRIAKFQNAARLTGGYVPMPLRYCGARTTGRDSGEEYNPQNMPRIIEGYPQNSDALRMSLQVPKGYKVIVADQSGIELRINHFLWMVATTMQIYAADPKADLYRARSARAYGIEPDRVSKVQRQIEKIKQLGLGFGAGDVAFVRVAKTMGGLDLTLEQSSQYVAEWRADHPEIAGRQGGWVQCAKGILAIANGLEQQVDPWGLVHTCREGFVLPSGRIIRYPGLRQMEDGTWPSGDPKTSWFYGSGRYRARITGPKADENIVQSLGRDSLFDRCIDFYEDTGWRPKLRVHDELAYVVPEKEAEGLLDHLQSLLRKPPDWWPELIVWSEGGIADRYGEAK